MGAIWFSRASLTGTLGEMVGYKSGLSLDREQMIELVPDHGSVFKGEMAAAVRVRAEEFEEILASILYGLGNIQSSSIAPVGMDEFHSSKSDRSALALFLLLTEDMTRRLNDLVRPGVASPAFPPISEGLNLMDISHRLTALSINMARREVLQFDRKAFAQEAHRKYGEEGAAMASRLIASFNSEIHRSPWLGYREYEFADELALTELFNNESLKATHGQYLDQRFINYLSSNEHDLPNMNWRKFEGLVGEYFIRNGYNVELGPGRNDDGIDARVWPKNKTDGDPETMLVQCKREKNAVQKIVVKGLWADMQHEGANSGLIVTTSTVSKGVKDTIKARAYPIEVAEGDTVGKWVHSMRTINAGPFLAE